MKYSDCCSASVADNDKSKTCPSCGKACDFIPEERSNKELREKTVVVNYGKFSVTEPGEDEHPELNVSEG